MFLYVMKRVVDSTERTKDHSVLCRNTPSFFTLNFGIRIDAVSVDRLKAANLLGNVTGDVCLDCTFKGNAACESSNPVEVAAAPSSKPAPVFCNRLGRIICMPARFDDYVPL